MSDQIHDRHDDDARADDAPPTDAVSDEVREDAASAEDHADSGENAEVTPESGGDVGTAETIAGSAQQGDA